MYSVALIFLACVTTTVLTETNAENADSQVALQAANRALLNDLKASKATNEALQNDLEAAKATNEASKATQEKALLVAQAAGLNRRLGHGSKKKAATKTATKGNSDPGAIARPNLTLSSSRAN
jgi:hypothetical protein